MKSMPPKAKALVVAVVLCCVALTTYAVMKGIPSADIRFALLLAMAVISARMKVKLPGSEANMSMNLPFILTGLAQLSLPHAIVIGMLSTFVQCLPTSREPMKLIQAAFNVCTMSNAIALSFLLASAATRGAFLPEKPALIVVGAVAFFLGDTIPIAAIISAMGGGRMWKVWSEMALLTFPYFVLSAGVATIIIATTHFVNVAWAASLPVMFVVYQSFRRYMREPAAKKDVSGARAFSAAAD